MDDYLNIWIKNTYLFLKDRVKDWDIVFSTTWWDLWSIKLGSLLKNMNNNIKFIVNYHDLLYHWVYNWEKISNRFHVKIDDYEKKYLWNCDYVISSSLVMKNTLVNKYSFLKEKITYMYFWFDNNASNYKISKSCSDKVKIFYVWNMWTLQSPEIIIDSLMLLDQEIRDKIEIYFIWDYSGNKVINDSQNIKRISYMNRNDLIKLLETEADYWFFSLIEKESLKYAMPTKFYEYIWLWLPIIWVLPSNCESMNLINKYKLWLSVNYWDVEWLKNILNSIVKDKKQINIYKNNINLIKEKFDSSNTLSVMKDVIELL